MNTVMPLKFPTCAILLLLLTAAYTSNAQSKITTPTELNNFYSSISDSLDKRGGEWGAKLQEAITTRKYAGLAAYRVSMETFINRKKQEVSNSPVIGGSEEFKKAVLKFLDVELSLTSIFKGFDKLTPASKAEEVNALVAKINENIQTEDNALAELQKVQSVYTKKNGLSIK